MSSIKKLPGLGLRAFYDEGDRFKPVRVENFLTISVMTNPAASAITNNLPPDPQEGDILILSAQNEDHPNHLAAYYEGKWSFFEPREGMRVWITTGQKYVQFVEGAWVESSGGCESFPDAPADGKIYGRRNNSWNEIPEGGGEAGAKSVNGKTPDGDGNVEIGIADIPDLESELDNKVDKQSGYGLSQENYTTAEKLKLAGLESSHFKGVFASLVALEEGVQNPQPGDYADVDEGEGYYVQRYIWDADDAQWVAQGGQGGVTPAQVKTMYESNPDTNAYTDAEKAKVAGLDAALADKASKSSANTFSGVQTFDAGVVEKHVTLSTGTIDLSLGNAFSLTVSWDTTISITNVPASGFAGFLLELTNGGSHVITWNNTIKWPGGVAPVLTENGVDVVFLYTIDGGASWRGFVREDLK